MNKKKVLIDGIEYIDPLRDYHIDPHDWSHVVKREYDIKDKQNLNELNKIEQKMKSRKQRKIINSKKCRDLRRWGYDG